VREPPDQIALDARKCRGSYPAAGLILNAQIRPYRTGAAAASDDGNGRGVDHGRGYKAAPGFRQYSKPSFRDALFAQTRNPEIGRWCWIPGSREERAPE
jgi:hypothetical protein